MRPITTPDELEAAMVAGERIEYTACGDDYAAPPHPRFGSGGWVDARELEDHLGSWREVGLQPDERYRVIDAREG